MEIKEYVQIAALCLTFISVSIALLTYHRARLNQQISELRSSLFEAVRYVETLDELLSERYAIHIAFCISARLEKTFGSSITVEELANFVISSDNKAYIVQAIYEGFGATRVASEIDSARRSFGNMSLSTKTLIPHTSVMLSDLAFVMALIVHNTFDVGHVIQIVGNDENLQVTVDSLRKSPNINLGYADLADSMGNVMVSTIEAYSQSHFDLAKRIFGVIADKILALSDVELRKMVRKDKKLSLKLASAGNFHERLFRIDSILTDTSDLFTQKERDDMIRSCTKLIAVTSK